MTFAALRKLAMTLPGVEEGTSYGTPAFRVRKKLLARMWKDAKTVVVKVDWDQRDTLLELDPDVFFLTDHYRNDPWICVHLASIQRSVMQQLLESAWHPLASEKQRREYAGA